MKVEACTKASAAALSLSELQSRFEFGLQLQSVLLSLSQSALLVVVLR